MEVEKSCPCGVHRSVVLDMKCVDVDPRHADRLCGDIGNDYGTQEAFGIPRTTTQHTEKSAM